VKQGSEIAPPKDGSATVFKAAALRAQSKEFLIKKYSDLCELRVSVVNTSSQETRNYQEFKVCFRQEVKHE